MKLIILYFALTVGSAATQNTKKETEFQIQPPLITPETSAHEQNDPRFPYPPNPNRRPFEFYYNHPSGSMLYSGKQQTLYAPSFFHQNIFPILQENEIDIENTPIPKPHPYPTTPPTLKIKIGLVANLGSDSKTKNGSFISYIREGHLVVKTLEPKMETKSPHHVSIEFPDAGGMQRIKSGLNNLERGFELSTLNAFHGKLYTCDEMTGIIYELKMNSKTDKMIAVPWLILPNEMDDHDRGEMDSTFKCKWATVKDNHLWIGSHGMGIDLDGKEVLDSYLVRKISPEGKITIIDWSEHFMRMAKILIVDLNIGLVHHEAVAWSAILRKWIFTPRRISGKKVDANMLDKIGNNMAILADEEFDEIETKELGEQMSMTGFTGVKLIPGTQDKLMLTIKAEIYEKTGKFISSLAVYDLDGMEIMKSTTVPGFGIFTDVEFL